MVARFYDADEGSLQSVIESDIFGCIVSALSLEMSFSQYGKVYGLQSDPPIQARNMILFVSIKKSP